MNNQSASYSTAHTITNMLRLIRPHQYVKNLFIFMPLFFAAQFTDTMQLVRTSVAFVAFSFAASSIYILNDYRDIEEDRQHPTKRYRPLAAGKISGSAALIIMALLFLSAVTLMGLLSVQALFILGLYVVMNIAYSFRLKHVAILDITVIALGFILRLFVGSEVTDVPLSQWIVIMTFLLALFLAMAKRRDDILIYMETNKKMRPVINSYNLKFIEGAMMIMASVTIVAYILYTTSTEVVERIQSPFVYLTSLYVILGILRYLQITLVENNSGAPTQLIMKDRFLQLTILAWIIHFIFLLY